MQRVYTAADRRKVLHVTVDGARRIRSVELAPDWQRSLQSQSLTREVKAAYLAACEQVAEATSAKYDDARADREALARAGAVLDAFLGSVPGAADLMRRLEVEAVRAERSRGGVSAEFDLRGELRAIEIRPRHAAEVDSEQLASDIREVLHQCEELASARREELASEFTGGKSLEERLEDNVDQLRLRMEELKARLP